jgi:hypothetical protein
MPRTHRILAIALAALAGACASSAPKEAHPQRVTFVDFRNGTRLELVNEAHTGRVEQYSELLEKDQATRKVQTDDVMAGLIDVLRDGGFDDQAQPGPAPRQSDGQSVLTLEIEDGDKVEYALGYKGMPAAQRQKLLALVGTLVELYNQTYGLQAVELKEGEMPFENPVGPTNKKAPKVQVGKG